jgi:hypothetical protein
VSKQLVAADGTPLLLMTDIERLTGWSHETVKQYASKGNRARSENRATVKDMPAAVSRVKVQMTKSNGDPLVVWTSLYRQDEIIAWLDARGVKRG